MLFPRSHAWRPLQKWLIAGAVVAGLAILLALVYSFERYHRGPDETALFGTWRGHYENTLGEDRTGYRFKADHTYEERLPYGDSESWLQRGRWYAGGDFLYLRVSLDDGSDRPFSTLQAWHIDAMTPTELKIHYGWSHLVLKRTE
jgi:hypothetical protein